MAIDKKIRFGEKVPQLVTPSKNGKRPGYRGDDAYGSSSRSNQATSSRAATSSTNSSAPGGSSGQETRGDGPVTPTRTTFPGNTQIVDTEMNTPSATIYKDPLNIKEQYRVGNTAFDSSGMYVNNPFAVGIEDPYMTKGLETNRYNNYLKANNLRGYVPEPINIPFMPLATKGLQVVQKFGNDKNTQFFADNVAGKYGYGYGIEDYQKYMSDRTSGKVGAYGNENMGQNAIDERSGGIMDMYADNTYLPLQQITPVGEDSSNEASFNEARNNFVSNFNFGTEQSPLSIYDLLTQNND